MSIQTHISLIIFILHPNLLCAALLLLNPVSRENINTQAPTVIDTTINEGSNNDSIPDTSRISIPDTFQEQIKFSGVTIYLPFQDTATAKDTILEKQKDQTAEQDRKDTVATEQDTVKMAEKDSLIMQDEKEKLVTKLDSAFYYMNKYTQKDTLRIIDDTLQTHIDKLIHFLKSQPIDSSINYLNEWLQKDTLKEEFSDTTNIEQTDSLINYLNYMLEYAEEDSVEFYIITKNNDTVPLWLSKEEKKDSSRLVLYDDLDNPAGLWVTPLNKNAIKLQFDENTVIEKNGFRKRREEDLPIIIDLEKLKKHKPIDMVFPQWRTGGTANLDFNQGYVKNWVKGGESTLSSLLHIKFNVGYKKGETAWDNDIEYKAGILQSGERGLRKNEDVFEINSKFGNNASKDWYYSALVNFTTQLFRGYDYPNDSVAVSGLLSPAYLVFSVGMDYKPSNDLTILLSPISSKYSMMRDTSRFDQTKFGISKDEKVKKELGAYVKSIYEFNVHEDIHIENKVKLFTNYLNKPQNIDIDWEVIVNMQITDYIKASVNSHLVYEDDIDFPVYEIIDGEETQVGTTKKIQFKEVISVGITYRF
ncbi:MAG: DUF3078 domain-containing protein [Bacteroidales bacterium]